MRPAIFSSAYDWIHNLRDVSRKSGKREKKDWIIMICVYINTILCQKHSYWSDMTESKIEINVDLKIFDDKIIWSAI